MKAAILAIVLFCSSFYFSLAFAEGQRGKVNSESVSSSFQLVVRASYRCYAGYDGKKLFDDRTHAECDNKTIQQKIVDEVVVLSLHNEPNPDNSKNLEASWVKSFPFQGRKFEVALSLFRDLKMKTDRLRLAAQDDEPVPRQTSVFVEAPHVLKMHPLFLDYSSVGKKEEITYHLELKPIKNK